MESNINSTHYQLDWTNKWDQNEVAGEATLLVDKILLRIYESKLEIHTTFNLNLFELGLLLRWPIHVGVNLFFERLLRVATLHGHGEIASYPFLDSFDDCYENTTQSVQAYYYDYSINYKLLNNLSDVLGCNQIEKGAKSKKLPRPGGSLNKIRKTGFLIKAVLKCIFLSLERLDIRYFKPAIIGEYSGWFRKLYPFGHCFDFHNHKFHDGEKSIDSTTRERIKDVCENVFVTSVHKIITTLSEQQSKQCAKLFSQWIDHVLPLSIIEGINERFRYYQILLKNWTPKQVHAFTGYYYNDNFKVFAILAKRKGAKLIGHSHGVNNYLSLFYKGANELYFVDYYTTYGLNKVNVNLINPGTENVKFIPTGSTAFKSVPKWNKGFISSKHIYMLYPSGPLMDFMSDLQEISPEKNLAHRLQVLFFLNQLLNKYEGLKIFYKPFPGTFTNDPIKEYCSDYLDTNRIELIDIAPLKFYRHVDLILWDSISTGFGECAAAGVPVIVFNSRYEYEQTSSRGRLVNDALTEAGVQCLDVDSAINSFEMIVHHPDTYKKETKPSIKMFKDDLASPVSRREWHQRFRQGIDKSKGLT